jgi:serine/threonine protein kinase/tetratricopeptide (TPR) repeat protein
MRSCPQCQSACDESHKFCPSCGFPVGKVAVNAEDPLIGRTLPGGYVILDLVGIGGMGRVYRAEQTNLARTVAVKIIHPHLVGEENAAARFITEARAASRLNHPNSVGVIDFGKTPDGQLYLVMEFLRGRDLARVAYEEGPLPFRRIVEVLRQVLAALSEAHHLQIIHRDLKPENIILEPMRTGGDFVKVVDFGLAKMREETRGGPQITSPGIVCGTPEYMSPEQGRGDPLDARSDLYAVGVILFQLLTGRLPFEADSPTQVVLMHLSTEPPDPRKVAPERNIPEVLVQLVSRALAKEPKNRYSDADEFGEALAGGLAQIEGPPSKQANDRLSTLKCPSCGSLNAPTQKFCGDCGAPTTMTVATSFGERDTAPPLRPASRTEISVVKQRDDADGAKLKFPLAFIGRDDDLAWLDERRNEAKSGLVAARIVGDPGMGKTRLMTEFLQVCAAADDVVVQTGPDPAWAEVGYYALRVAIRSLAGLPEDGGVEREWVAASAEARRGISDVFERFDNGSPSSVRLSPDERRFAAAEALRWALTRASERARGHRVLLAVDDIHHVDGASRNAFADVVCEPPLAPVLLLATSAAGFDPGWPAMSDAPRALSGLPAAIVAKLIAATGVPSAPSLNAGRGIAPLYLDQVIRFGREHGGQPPARLADLIALRVERLPADARRVLQALAVLGDSTSDEQLLPLLPGEPDVVEALGLLRRSGMIESAADRWRVAHPLMRDVVLATIPALVRRELHGAAAKSAEATRSTLEVQALHEYYAHNAFDALILLEKVSSRCEARCDIAGTILALRRGLELARRELFRGELDDPMRAVLIFGRKLGEALAQAGDYMDAEGVLREALDMAGPNGPDRARVLGALAHVAFGRDRRLEAQVYLREAMELARRSGARELVTSLEQLKRQNAV